MLLPEISLAGTSLFILIGIVVAVLKRLGFSSRWLPATSILCGILFGLFVFLTGELTLSTALVGGGIIGASVSGLYDFGKKTILNN